METLKYDSNKKFINFIKSCHEFDNIADIGIVVPAEETTQFLKDLIKNAEYDLACINFVSLQADEYAYKDEYIININADGIWCEPAKRGEKYLRIIADTVYVFGDCNSDVLKHIISQNTYEVDICEDDDNKPKMTHFVSHNESGDPDGFTITLNNKTKNGHSHSVFSYFNNNVDSLKEVAEQFGLSI